MHNDFVGKATSTVDVTADEKGEGRGRASYILDVCHEVLGCGTLRGKAAGPVSAEPTQAAFSAVGTSGDFVGLEITGISAPAPDNVFLLVGEAAPCAVFPDVCPIPAPSAGPIPIPLPDIGNQ